MPKKKKTQYDKYQINLEKIAKKKRMTKNLTKNLHKFLSKNKNLTN